MKVSIDISTRVTPQLRGLIDALEGPDKKELHEAMGHEVQATTVEYLRDIAATRHATANRLGAAPSNFLAQAVEKVAAPSALSAETDAATLTINHPGLTRAFRDVTIKPVSAKALTIPIHAMAYNRRAGQFPGIFRLGGRGQDVGKNVLAIKDGDSVLGLFLLVRSVTQKQDRSLLPSNEEWSKSAAKGLGQYLQMRLAGGGQ